MMQVDAWPGLNRAASCGPFFELVRWDGRGPAVDAPGWHPMTAFADHPLGLASRVDAARESLLTRGLGERASVAVVLRVAASVAFLGLAARLLSPAIGAAVAADVAPDLTWEGLYWRPAATGVLPLATGPTDGIRLGSASGRPPGSIGARFLLDTALAPVLRLSDAVADRYRVPNRVVAGNVASALVGAAAVAGRGEPVAGAVVRLITDLLAEADLASTGRVVRPTGDRPGIRFRRRSCCLLYRVDDAALCGDCVLHQQPRRQAGGRHHSAPTQQQDAGRNRHQQDRDR
jgi:hypothetical protein